MSWRKLLSLVGSLTGALVGVPVLGGCTQGIGGGPRITRENPFPFMPEHEIELCGTKRLAELKNWTRVRFGEPLGFNRAGETIDATAYAVVTFLDGRVFGGKYAMKATFVKGDSGGPAGSVTEYSVEVEDVHLIERMVKPKVATAGAKVILPGEFVIKKISSGGVAQINDKYVVELPANKHAFVEFESAPTDYPFQVSISKDGVLLHTAFVETLERARGYHFETAASGLFDIAVRGVVPTGQIPDRYQFYVGWGHSRDRTSAFRPDWVELKDPSTVEVKAAGQHEQQKGE